ncbi:hypothetical protein GPALN_014688 [Globodera pallida]|nr:hypothetical protein GPALN_014688 [Globodera pallida]
MYSCNQQVDCLFAQPKIGNARISHTALFFPINSPKFVHSSPPKAFSSTVRHPFLLQQLKVDQERLSHFRLQNLAHRTTAFEFSPLHFPLNQHICVRPIVSMTKLGIVRRPSYCTHRLREGAVTVFEDSECCQAEFAAQIADNKSLKGDHQPYFVMDIGRVVELLELWTKYLPRVQPFYALKCNADPMLLRLMAAHSSVGFSCTNSGEMLNALHYMPAERVCCSFPCWTRSSLRQADECGVGLLCFESERDLDRILTNHPSAKLLLSVRFDSDSDNANALFGVPLAEAAERLKLCAELGLDCVGISISIDPANWLCNSTPLSSVCSFVIEWSARLFLIGIRMGLRMNVLNIGDESFMCSSSVEDWSFAQFTEFCAELNRSLDVHFPLDGIGHGLHIMATPGQLFASTPFSLVTNVIDKRCTDASFVTNNDLDAGNDAFLYQTNESYYGTFGCRMMLNNEPRCAPLFDDNVDSEQRVYYGTMFGLTGFDNPDTDIVQSVCQFRQLDIGDWLFWSNIGAYAFGNRGSLDDDDDDDDNAFGAFQTPPIFYFVSRANWESVCRKLDIVSSPEQQQHHHVHDGPFAYGGEDSDSDGSVGEPMLHSDTEETDGCGAEEDEFWPVGWPVKFND